MGGLIPSLLANCFLLCCFLLLSVTTWVEETSVPAPSIFSISFRTRVPFYHTHHIRDSERMSAETSGALPDPRRSETHHGKRLRRQGPVVLAGWRSSSRVVLARWRSSRALLGLHGDLQTRNQLLKFTLSLKDQRSSSSLYHFTSRTAAWGRKGQLDYSGLFS